MRMNDDQKTVRAMDILFPGIGEIVGGSQREERLKVLERELKKWELIKEELWWYIELRKFGSTPHSGFGLGFERLVQFATGIDVKHQRCNPISTNPSKRIILIKYC